MPQLLEADRVTVFPRASDVSIDRHSLWPSRTVYWQCRYLTSGGQSQISLVQPAQALLLELADWASDRSETALQLKLWQLWQQRDAQSHAAELSLRCLISHAIYQHCQRLAARFGQQHGFICADLLPYVLLDRLLSPLDLRRSASPESLVGKILQTFNPAKQINLSTWATRLTHQQPDLKACLREHGLYLISDWALLNNTKVRQLRQALGEFYQLPADRVQAAAWLLEAYHQVYRAQHLQLPSQALMQPPVSQPPVSQRSRRTCPQPTTAQLTQILQQVAAHSDRYRSPTQVLRDLQTLAGQLRHYAVCRRRGQPAPRLQSLDLLPHEESIGIPAVVSSTTELEQTRFLLTYHHCFLACVDRAMQQAVSDRLASLRQADPTQAQLWLTAIDLLYRQQQSMRSIAPQIGKTQQAQVSNFMQLTEFRAAVQRHLERLSAQQLRPRLATANPAIDEFLQAQIDEFLTEAKAELSCARRPRPSLFAQRLLLAIADQRENCRNA